MPEQDDVYDLDYDEQVRLFTSTVQRRDQIPSPREVDAGMAPDDAVYRPAVALPKPPRTTFVQRMRERLSLLNPRGIAADRRGLYALICLGLLNTVALWDDIIISTSLPVIQIEMGFDFQFMLTLTAMVDFVGRLGMPVLGHVADRVKRVRMVQLGAVVGNVSSLVVAFAGTPHRFAVSRVVGSVGPVIQTPAEGSLSIDYFPVDRRARSSGFLQMAQLLGGFVVFIVIIFPSFVLGWFSWRTGLIASALLAVGATVTLFWLKEPVRGEWERRALGLPEDAELDKRKPLPWAEAWRVVGSIKTLRRMWYAAPFIAAGTSAGNLTLFVVQERAARDGAEALGPGVNFIYSPTFIPLMRAVPLLIAFIATLYAVPVADRLIKRNAGRIMVILGVVQLMTGLGMLAMAASPWLIGAVAFNWIVMAGPPLIGVAQTVLLAFIIPARVRSLGIVSVLPWGVLGLILSPVVGGIADVFGPTVGVLAVMPLWFAGAAIYMSGAATVAGDVRSAVAASAAEDETKAAKARGVDKMLVCRDVNVAYDGTQVLFGVDFDVDAGELVAILGTNGAGKSTLLRAICGLQEASNGAVFLDGEDVTHKPTHLNARDGIVFLPGGRAIFPTLTVEENLKAACWLYREDEAFVAERTERVLAFFPILRERLHERAGNLSGGEQQMTALGQAFLMQPRLLMIDELSLGLAPAVVEQLLGIVRAIRDEGTTVIVVEQSVNVALSLADRSIFLDKGVKLFDGPTAQLLERPDLVRSVFLGGVGAAGLVVRHSVKRSPIAQDPSDDGRVEPILAAIDLHVRFGGVKPLDGAGVAVQAGEIVGVIGPNGAGKTTLFDALTGFVTLESGQVLIDGDDVTDASPDARARLGLSRSFQNTRLFASLTVKENIAVALERQATARSAALAAAWAPNVRRIERRIARRVEYFVDALNLGRFSNKFVSELSTGSRRMVELACLLAAEPRVLLLDEPSSGLAQAEIEMLGPAVQRVARETGAGVLVIEHDMPLITGISDRLVALERGRVIVEGAPADVITDARVVQSYLGMDQAAINRSDGVSKALSALIPTDPPTGETHS